MSADPTPTDITLHAKSRVLEVSFSDGQVFKLPFEFLRVFTPSAEARGHGPGQETLQVGKRDVTVTRLDPVGHYAGRAVGRLPGAARRCRRQPRCGRSAQRRFRAGREELRALSPSASSVTPAAPRVSSARPLAPAQAAGRDACGVARL